MSVSTPACRLPRGRGTLSPGANQGAALAVLSRASTVAHSTLGGRLGQWRGRRDPARARTCALRFGWLRLGRRRTG
eukprot:1757182-Pyramimonas_sp.AAC.1